jgi:hypothetical protein
MELSKHLTIYIYLGEIIMYDLIEITPRMELFKGQEDTTLIEKSLIFSDSTARKLAAGEPPLTTKKMTGYENPSSITKGNSLNCVSTSCTELPSTRTCWS